MFVNQSQLSGLLGISRMRIRELEEQGRIRRLPDGRYDAASAYAALADMDPGRRMRGVKNGRRGRPPKPFIAAVQAPPVPTVVVTIEQVERALSRAVNAYGLDGVTASKIQHKALATLASVTKSKAVA